MRMKDFRAFVTDLWVRLCTFLLLVLESEVDAFSKGQKEERELKIGDGRRSCGFEVNEKRKKDGEEGRWREKGLVSDQEGLVAVLTMLLRSQGGTLHPMCWRTRGV